MTTEALEEVEKGDSKKKVHFEQPGNTTKPKQKSKKAHKKKSNQSTENNVETQSTAEEKTSSKDAGVKLKGKKKRAKDGEKSASWKKISSKVKDQGSKERSESKGTGKKTGPSTSDKKKATDLSKKWPFVDLKDQLKMDAADVVKIMLNKEGGPKNKQKYSPLDIDKTNIPTMGLMRKSNDSLQNNFETLDVLSAIDDQQNRRHQEHIASQLEVIQKRVHKTLDDYGMAEESDEEEEDLLRLPAIKTFDSNSERKKMEERNYVIDRIDAFEEKAVVRKQYLTEMMHWFEDNLNLCHDVVTPDELKDMIQTTSELHHVISKSLETFIANGDEVVEKGKLLLAETSKIIEERKAQMAKKTRKERIIVYDDKILLADPTKWESASKTILSVFEDSHKMIKNLMFKNAIKLCQKQFDYMMISYDKRMKELDEKKKQCIDLQGKLHSAKMQSDKLGREIEEQKRKFIKQSQDLSDTKTALEKLQAKNKEMHDKLVELTSKIKFLQQELTEKNKTPTPPPTPPPPPSPERVYVKVVDSSTELRLKEVEQELENAKKEIEKYLAELHEVRELYSKEKGQNKGLLTRIAALEKEAAEQPSQQVMSTAEQLLQEARKPSEGQDKDVNYYKTLMSGMKKEFESELEKVKSHVRKEKTRGDASIKKMEFLHKDHLTNIHRDTVRMLRGILHFREHMMVCFEKENLVDQAQALFDLGDIVKDKLSPDPKEVLATIVGTVVDYMNKMEGILSNAFLALRVLMRYQIDKQVEAEVQQKMAMKEIQKKAREMKAPKKNVNNLAKSLKKAKNKLKKAKQNINSFASDKKYLELLTRYNNMMKLYKGMQKEMEVLQCDFHDTIQKKLEEKETMMISQMKMEMKQKRAQVEEHLKMTIADQKQNLRILSIAYEQNKISKDLHMMATAMIQKTMEIPRRKLKTFFEKYITFRTIKDSKERVARVLKDETANLSIDTRDDMEQYIQTIDGKFRQGMKKWKDEMKVLDDEKLELNKKIYNLFNEALVETGVLFVHPLLREKNKTVRITKAASNMNRTRVKDILYKRKKRCKEFLHLPDELLGKSVTIGQGDTKLWSQKDQHHPSGGAKIVLPHMMAYDVNKTRIDASRTVFGRRQHYSLGRTESFNITKQNYVQFIRDTTSHERLWNNSTVCTS